MNLNCGIIGLPLVGKTTIFNLLTGAAAKTSGYLSGRTGANTGAAKIPDRRLDFLSDLFKPRKTTYAQMIFSDIPGLTRGTGQSAGSLNQFLEAARDADLLVHVVRAFQNAEVPHVDGEINPRKDVETVNTELLLADMELVEKRIERIKSGKKVKKEQEEELSVLEKCLSALEGEMTVGSLALTDEERRFLKNYSFFTSKPMILVVNTDEEQLKSGTYPFREELLSYAAKRGFPVLEVCGRLEMEISQLPEADREIFLSDLGIEQPGIERLARSAYEHLGLISFFTVGEDEVKAWTIHRGTQAKKAAGKVHSDMERGFIRAEVVKFRDLKEWGSMARVREKGLFRLEGKEYIVEDGDIINFRFNVK